ncbi:hypothetical protein [Marinicella sp. W31]|uniref:hypothetical protein n=1 Tax=Marinicella sp. W31 TaxID=3023713 RepID=UPI003756E4FE
MSLLTQKARVVFSALPREFIAGLWRLILTLIIAFLYLLKFIWERLRFKDKCKAPEWPKEARCCHVPEQVKRKPDPCIYSQAYRMSQGLSVTWNNPDIDITLPDGTLVDSSTLQPDTDYRVKARISNASFDPALATSVRCYYRPWSFNSPDTTPVELNPDGTEAVRIVHISPWQNATAEFTWRTPKEAGHYCLKVECRHPDDINPNNNIGQENTNVVAAAAGENFSVNALLANPLGEAQQVRVFADAFTMPEDEVQLKLKTLRIPLRKQHSFDGFHQWMLTNNIREKRLALAKNQKPFITRYAYSGWESLKRRFKRGLHPIGNDWQPQVEGQSLKQGWAEIEMQGQQEKPVQLSFQVPANAKAGDMYAMNFTAVDARGKTLGGVTLHIRIER